MYSTFYEKKSKQQKNTRKHHVFSLIIEKVQRKLWILFVLSMPGIIKARLDGVLGSLTWSVATLPTAGDWNWMVFKVFPAQAILWFYDSDCAWAYSIYFLSYINVWTHPWWIPGLIRSVIPCNLRNILLCSIWSFSMGVLYTDICVKIHSVC